MRGFWLISGGSGTSPKYTSTQIIRPIFISPGGKKEKKGEKKKKEA